MKASTAIRAAATVLLVVAASVSIYQFQAVRQSLVDFLGWVQQIGPLGPVYLGAAYVLATVLFIPGSILTLGAGFAFGLLIGTITVSVASMIGASAAFWLGRTLLRGWVSHLVEKHPRFRAIDRAVGESGFKIVLLTRLSPLFPFNFLNYAFGITRVRFRDYFLASWVGMLPGTVMYVYLGSAMQSLAALAAGEYDQPQDTPGYDLWQRGIFVVGLMATVGVTILITRIARRALEEAVPLDPTVKANGEEIDADAA